MNKTELLIKITEWINWTSTHNQYDISLFKIWINFEKYYSEMFRIYAIGGSSEDGYTPIRRLSFDSDEQFNAFLKNSNSTFIDYTKQIPALSPFIFNPNPFDFLTSDLIYHAVFDEVSKIRNFIAHESPESKKKLQSLPQFKDEYFNDFNKYLKLNKKNHRETIYSYYVEKIKEMAELISNPIVVSTAVTP